MSKVGFGCVVGALALLTVAIAAEPRMSKQRARASSGAARACVPDSTFVFTDLGDLSGFRLNGDARRNGNDLQITRARSYQVGSAYLDQAFTINADSSFSTHFVFRMHGPGSDGADGLAFVIQGAGPTMLGDPGEGLGYQGIAPSLAIELDTYENGYDPDANHVGLNIDGLMDSVRVASPGFNLEDERPHGVWIDYDGATDTLSVSVGDDPLTRPLSPLFVESGIDLVGSIGSDLYIGFAAATGARYRNQDIESWSLKVGGTCTSPPLSAAPRIESGRVTVGGSDVTVPLALAYLDPVVVATVNVTQNSDPVLTRVSNVGGSSFDVRLENPSGLAVASEEVSYLVVEQGRWTLDGHRVEASSYLSTVTDHDGSWVGEPQSFQHSYTRPVVLGHLQSANDPLWSVFWCRGEPDRNQPPDATALYTGKSVCEDPAIGRADEEIGTIIFEAGHGFIGGVEFEATLGADSINGYDDGSPHVYTFGAQFATPVTTALLSINGMDGPNGGWATTVGSPAATDSRLYLTVDEDQLGDAERSHTTENVAYAVFAGDVVYEPAPCTGDTDCDDGLFCNGAESCIDGYCNAVTDPCFGNACDEATDSCDLGPQARFETLTVDADGVHRTVALTNSYDRPVVVCTAQARDNVVPIVPRVSAVGASSFDLRLQNPSGDPVVSDPVTCLIVEEGSWTIDGVRLGAQRVTSTVTAENNAWIGQTLFYDQAYTAPVVLGQVMTENDSDWSVFWCQGGARNDPPSATSLIVGKSVCEDTDVTRADEELGVIVFESGHGILAGVEYEAALGPDVNLGVQGPAPYANPFVTPFADDPRVALATMAGIDGGNGGWAVVYGAVVATTDELFLAIDEDQIGDAERSHISEQVGYVVFEEHVIFTPPTDCLSDFDCDDGNLCNGIETCIAGSCETIPIDCDDPFIDFF